MGIRRFVTVLSAASVAVVAVLAVSPRWSDRVGAARPLPRAVTRTVVAASGRHQVAGPGRPLAAPLVVRVLDDRGRPVRGATVRFAASVPSVGGGVLLDGRPSSTDITDAAGRASVHGVASTQAGQVEVVAWVAGSGATATFTVRTAEPGADLAADRPRSACPDTGR